MCLKPCNRGARGFTLIELLVVVAIVGMLSAIAVPMYSKVLQKGRTTALAGDLKYLYDAMMRYHADNGKFPGDAEFDLASLDPLASDGYYNQAHALTGKLSGDQITLYLAPDVDGTDDQFIVITRHALDPSIIVVAVHTNIVGAAGGWIDGVYIITESELAEADEI